ncbi:LysR family transcriptional regulator [Amaricoccus sp.]|uniref:LysR family transcriptional regulator n=1 Tax=Amaricoccus sp. TaxID=1872485 RepID=UPI001B5404BF|nr:LysR family transcriptional regulator [Amaricoccus sp.]MBP7001890.1 LysR family transcriptional regulator [Amaricoccus sp.]
MDWLTLPSLGALRAFAALAQTGSFTAAGAALNVSHAAVSQQVRALEDRLGATLVDRGGGRRLALTPEGARLAAALQEGFRQIRRGVDELTGADAGRPLQVTVTPLFASAWLMPRLPAFLVAHPDLDLLLNPTYDLVELAPGGVDVAIRYGRGDWAGLSCELLLPSDFMIVAAPGLVAGRRVAAAADLLDLPWIVEIGANEMTRWLAEQGVVEGPRRTVTQVPNHSMLEAVRAGIGISVMARPAALAEIAAGRLVEVFAPPPGGGLADEGAGYWIVTRPGVMRPPLKAFVSWLRSQV